MALQLNFTLGTYDRVNNLLPITDSTGNYDAGTNPGGYGAPNPDRSSFALVATTRVVSTTTDRAIINTDPVTDSTWSYDFGSDGVYEVYLVGLPIETSPDVSLLAEDYVYWETVNILVMFSIF
jgi:hypothetical protein